MNKLTIIGNLTRAPELRTNQNGNTVCSFTVAVNRRNRKNEVDYFRVSAWNGLGENCQKYLAKGRKVAVVGKVSASAYMTQSGKAAASLEVLAEDVVFLSPKEQSGEAATDTPEGYQEVTDDDCPF